MPFYIIRIEDDLILPGEFKDYISAVENCDINEEVFIADSREVLEEILGAIESGEETEI